MRPPPIIASVIAGLLIASCGDATGPHLGVDVEVEATHVGLNVDVIVSNPSDQDIMIHCVDGLVVRQRQHLRSWVADGSSGANLCAMLGGLYLLPAHESRNIPSGAIDPAIYRFGVYVSPASGDASAAKLVFSNAVALL